LASRTLIRRSSDQQLDNELWGCLFSCLIARRFWW
jgi:hypothetical protein